MKYDECLQVLSPARLNKYAQASGYEKAKTLRLYQYNIKLSQRFYGVIGMFEIMLRNAINAHYKQYFNDDNWIINQARPNGLLEFSPHFPHACKKYSSKSLFPLVERSKSVTFT